VICHQAPSTPFDIGPFYIRASLVSHPGPTVGYRIEGDGGALAYLCDHEPALGLQNGRWPRSEWISGFDLAVGVDPLIHDAQYTDEEYERYIGWGHSTYRHAFEFAAQVDAKEIIPFHHDPSHDDEMLDCLHETAVRTMRPGFVVSHGCEGAIFDVRSKS